MKSRVTTALNVMLMAGWLGGCGGEQPGTPATTAAPPRPPGLTIAMIAKSTTNPIFLSARKGAETAARELAEKHGVPRVHIALAWLLQKEPVTAPIVGATKISHLEDAVGALSVKLTQEEVTYLEEPYAPHRIVGHQ